jgi:PqqD family protein of HPr-rel-A system
MALLQQDPRVQATAVGDRLVLFHRDTQATTVLNPTGSRLWEALASPCGVRDLAATLLARHEGLAPERAEADVSAFLASLQEHGLLMRHG